MAASGSKIAGITGFYAVTNDTQSTCPGEITGTAQPSTTSTNPSPIYYVTTSVGIGATTGEQASITIRLNSILDTSGNSAGDHLTFVPGTYTMTNRSNGLNAMVTATSVCAATNANGACTAITLTWNFTGMNTTADNVQQVPFRVGLQSGTTVPAGKEVSTGFYGEAYGGGPAGTSAGQTATFRAGTYSGSASC